MAPKQAHIPTRKNPTLSRVYVTVSTAALAKMNMILHNNPTAEIWRDNSLANPYFKHENGTLKTFDFVVANPPFSSKAWSTGFDPYNDLYERFVDGVPPQKNGDYAFLLHIIRSLKSTGKGAVILPHGVLFRGNAEADIRKNIIRKGYIKAIIGLPANLFYGTGIPACIIVIDKENAANRTGIFMIDASKGFMKDGNKNRLRHQDIHKIVDVFNKQLELPKYSRMVSVAEIEANDYNLNIPRYIDSSEAEDLHDIEAHLLGGIPNYDIDALSAYWQIFPILKQQLFAPVPTAPVHPDPVGTGLALSAVPAQTITETRSLTQEDSLPPSAGNLRSETHKQNMVSGSMGDQRVCPNTHVLTSMTACVGLQAQPDGFADRASPVPTECTPQFVGANGLAPVRSGYSQLKVDIAQIKPTIFTHPEFVTYTQTVTALFAQWQANNTPALKSLTVGNHPKQLIETIFEDLLRIFTAAQLIDTYDIYQHMMSYWTDTMQDDVYMIASDGWKANSDLIPRQLIINRYFAADQQHIETLEAVREAITQQMEELNDEHGGEGGLLEEAKNEKGKITRASINTRLKDLLVDPDATDERSMLNKYLHLLDQETEANRKVKAAQKALDAKATAKYKSLSEDEVKTLVIDDKWLATLASDVQSELNRVSQVLTGRVKELAERYATPLPELSEEIEMLGNKVDAHLKMMGFVW